MNPESVIGAAPPVISVVLPVYNTEKFIAQAIQSILNQTFSDFELIIIDDGSTDGTLKILTEFKNQDKRIVLLSRQNRGIAETLNEGIHVALGSWIAIMNADDIALPNRFERQLEWIGQTNADICGSWVQFFGTSNSRILTHPQSNEAIRMGLLFGCVFAQPSVMMKTALVRKLQYDRAWKVAEDYDLWERATHHGWQMANVPEVLLMYRQHENQISVGESTNSDRLTQKIRRRYWLSVFSQLNLNSNWADEVLKLRDLPLQKPNMDEVDHAFIALLENSSGEARATVFDHMTRLYFRAAGICKDVPFRWSRLNARFGDRPAVMTKLKLHLLSILRIHPDGVLFRLLKRHFAP
jgi:glycosyltransferase involved in cell wall biosynthesis